MDRPSFFQSCISFTPTTPAILRCEFLLNQQVQVVLVNNETTLKTPKKRFETKKKKGLWTNTETNQIHQGCCWLLAVVPQIHTKGTNQIHLNLPTNQDLLRGSCFLSAFHHPLIWASSVSLPLPLFLHEFEKVLLGRGYYSFQPNNDGPDIGSLSDWLWTSICDQLEKNQTVLLSSSSWSAWLLYLCFLCCSPLS